MSPQLSCGDTWQIWTWPRESHLCFCKIEIFHNGWINEHNISNPHPWAAHPPWVCSLLENVAGIITDPSPPIGAVAAPPHFSPGTDHHIDNSSTCGRPHFSLGPWPPAIMYNNNGLFAQRISAHNSRVFYWPYAFHITMDHTLRPTEDRQQQWTTAVVKTN